MAVNAARSITINLTGDVILDKIYSAVQNAISPGSVTVHTLSSGNNQINLPTITGQLVTAATILPPSGNLQALILKGTTAGDAGLPISKTEPTSVAFDTTPPAHIHINAAGTVNGLRIVWT